MTVSHTAPQGYSYLTAVSGAWFRAQRDADSAPVFLELHGIGSAQRRAWELAERAGIAALLARPLGNGPWAVCEDAGFASLAAADAMLRELPQWLACAHALALALTELHRHHIVHLGLRPATAWFDASRGQARFTGFEHADVLHHGALTAEVLVEPHRLPYLAPEQTGRLALGIDDRSDLYSLGVLLYELATGRRPFEAADSLGWMHSHIAQLPLSPRAHEPGLPQVIADIILKLLAKAPEERYQSAAALTRDLERCRRSLDGQGVIASFVLARGDLRQMLTISPALIGRDNECSLLQAALRGADAGGAPLVLVAGFSGIGKSVLVQHVVAGGDRLFISGKFDQYQRGTPYATLVHAFREQFRRMMGEDETELMAWRGLLRAALGENARVIAEVVPDLELVLGVQPPLPALGPGESRNRFNLVFQRFIQAFASAERPLALFLDDMQWADTATLELVQSMAAGAGLRHVCLILAYRDNEVDPQHPLRALLDRLSAAGIDLRCIALGPLDLKGIGEHLSASLHRSVQAVRPLARLVLQKTGGNPFFVNEFLKALSDKGLIAPDEVSSGWAWDLARIEAEDITDNLIELLVERLGTLPEATREALTLASAFGNQVDLPRLSTLLQCSASATTKTLAPAASLGLVTWLGVGEVRALNFCHDRIQQAAYSLTLPTAHAALHLRIGRLLLAAAGPQPEEELLFDIVNQLNAGLPLIDTPVERQRVGWLNASAGQRAKAAIAYDSALRYFDVADQLLDRDALAEGRETGFAFQRDHAECEFLAGRLDAAHVRFERLLGTASDDVERSEVYFLWIKLQQVAGDFRRALALGIEAVALFGIALPTSSEAQVQAVAQERRAIIERLGTSAIGTIVELPPCHDARMRAAIFMLTSLGPPAFLGGSPGLFPLIVTKAVNLSLEHGNCEASCFAYSLYAMLLVSSFDDIPAGFEFSQMCIRLNERLGDPKFKGTVLHIHGSHINPWCHRFAAGFSYLERGFAACVEVGDVTMANYNGFQGSWQYVMASARLDEADASLDKYLDFARRSGHRSAWLTIRAQRQLQRALQGAVGAGRSLDGEGFDAIQALAELHVAGFETGVAFVLIAQVVLAVSFGDFAAARAAAQQAAPTMGAVFSLPIEADFHFYRALALAADAEDLGQLGAEAAAALDDDIERMGRWAAHGPDNFEHRHHLLSAERARLVGDLRTAMRLYERAIVVARKSGALRDAALACETAGRFYLASGANGAGETCLREASALYRDWGAHAKQQQIDCQLYPALANVVIDSASGAPAAVDLHSLTKAMQAISGEIDRERLLEALMRNALEQAGAQSGRLLLCMPGAETLTLVRATDSGAAPEPLEAVSMQDLPASLLAFAMRSRQPVILHDASERHRFAADPCWGRRKVRSVLCLPLVKQADLLGLLYLENNLAPGAFSPGRLFTLEVLAAQIAISLDNARLYDDLKASTEWLDLAVVAGDIGVWSWDLRNQHVAWSETMQRISGRNPVTLDDGMLSVHPDDRARISTDLERVLVGIDDRLDFEYRVVHLDGTVRELATRGSITRRDEAGRPITVAGIAHDLTERNQAVAHQQALLSAQAARAEAEANSRAKDVFLATLAHELRNPLAPIVSGLQVLEHGADGEAAARLGVMMGRHARHLTRLVDDLLEISRLTHGKIELHSERVDLVEITARSVESVRPLLDERRHALAWEGDTPGLLWVDADPVRMAQVIANLLTNSAKYTPPGGHIVIALRRDGDAALISVRDDGQGISTTLLQRVFDLFEQGAPRTATAESGAGLGIGLALVRRLVALHGGEVSASSEGPGRGSEFCVRLPLCSAPTRAQPEAILPTAAELAGMDVLVVDDNCDAADSLGELLQLLGAEVRTVYNGEAALAAIAERPPAVAVIDIGMPGMGGHELARRIRTEPRLAAITLVALTGWGEKKDRELALAAGFNHHLVKPIDVSALLAILSVTPHVVP